MGNAASCQEGDWEELPAGPIFRSVKELDVDELNALLKDPKWQARINDKDGDQAGALHILGLNFKKSTYLDAEAKAIVQAFMKAGGDINLRNGHEETPLIMACCYGNYGVSRALIEAGCSVDATDWKGDTALSCAKRALEEKTYLPKERCQKNLDLIQEALKKDRDTNVDAKRAEDMRLLGNQFYASKDFEKVAKLYTNSLELYEDYRTYGNRAAAYIKIAWYRLFNDYSGYRRHFKKAYDDSIKATGMEKTYEKGYFRGAKAMMGYRNFTQAKMRVKQGLKHCPESKVLQELLQQLNNFGVPDRIVNHLSENYRKVLHKLENGWVGEERCPWCELIVLEHPIPEHCPFCACDTGAEIDQDAIVELCMKDVFDIHTEI
mmetsp:Transcript_22857/g.26003  ORF Transcript_22857/g.26003 Transcript_22857/m.26003 type:complete len:378 (-) Transcript_22857:591-1724(-)